MMTLSHGYVARIWGFGLCLFLFGCHGSHERISPAVLLDAGWNNYRLGEFDLAQKNFEQTLRQAAEGSTAHLAALYGAAVTWDLRRPGENAERAAQLYRAVIASAPTNDLAAWSWLALARMKATRPPGREVAREELLRGYQEVTDRFPHHPAGEEALLFQQAALLETSLEQDAQAVLATLERFLRTHPESPWRNAAYRLIGHACDVLRQHPKRLEAALQELQTQEIDRLNPSSDLSWPYWSIAVIAEFDVGDFARARQYYRKLIAEYPTDQKVFLAKQELARMDA
ncbi:MAG: tetratricopeptide repeat protein, partial [bacterium]